MSGGAVAVDAAMLDYASRLRAECATVAEIVKKTKIPRISLYRHLPARPPQPTTGAGEDPKRRD